MPFFFSLFTTGVISMTWIKQGHLAVVLYACSEVVSYSMKENPRTGQGSQEIPKLIL